MRIDTATTDADFADVRDLFRDYDRSLAVDLSSQGFAAEIAVLPGSYGGPAGALLLCRGDDGAAIGTVAVRPFDRHSAELKRLYVRPAGRGRGAGRALVGKAIEFARDLGYAALLLDSLPSMTSALGLYDALGFHEIDPYWNNTLPGIRYFRLALR